MEELSKSPVGGVIESAISVARPAVAVASALVASGNTATGLAVAGSIIGGLGIVDWFRRLGSSKVDENLDSLGQATEDALDRVANTLREHGTSIEEIKARIESPEFKNGMASASLQALRTTQKDRLNRMALILANGVREKDLSSESLDDMMRAAVELTVDDIRVLSYISAKQSTKFPRLFQEMDIVNNTRSVWQDLSHENFITAQNQMAIRASLARLQSFGFGAEVATTDSTWVPRFTVFPSGMRFLSRLLAIDATD
ncbi:MAG: hypothetical protein ABSD72_12090 [Terracidiphilus sp.]